MKRFSHGMSFNKHDATARTIGGRLVVYPNVKHRLKRLLQWLRPQIGEDIYFRDALIKFQSLHESYSINDVNYVIQRAIEMGCLSRHDERLRVLVETRNVLDNWAGITFELDARRGER